VVHVSPFKVVSLGGGHSGRRRLAAEAGTADPSEQPFALFIVLLDEVVLELPHPLAQFWVVRGEGALLEQARVACAELLCQFEAA
jgi:hypothetical protein